ncbi:unnamed protein product [Candidula unifasciata]|uniref:SAM-dependent MTase RsmB/NOP-type domain-containing protein n=1 Tax=Candidula unifasciata TaxID=100452 RepID=A0A8S3YUK3_9EUPU|nr:unnamed protein product [Candidula unifasciata]
MTQLTLHPDVYQTLLATFHDETRLDSLLSCLTSPPMFTTLRFDTSLVDGHTALETLSSCLAKQCKETHREKYVIFQHPVLPDCLVIQNRGPHSLQQHQKEVIVDLASSLLFFPYLILHISGPTCLSPTVNVYFIINNECLFYCPHGIGVRMFQPVYEAPSLAEVSLAWISAQNLPSITCVHALDPQKGELILDMCAAPGGKTCHIAALIGNQGSVIALEKSKERARKMENLKSACIEIYTFDSTKAVADDAVPSNGPPFPPGTFDRILVDAPCSALGQRPSYVNKMTLNQLKSFPVIQHKLLLTAVKLLKPGGVLVYSTCTITREENEDQVARLLARCSCMDLVDIPMKLGGVGLSGCDLTEEQRLKVQRFDPTSTESAEVYNIDTIGFFIAKFVKKEKELLQSS